MLNLRFFFSFILIYFLISCGPKAYDSILKTVPVIPAPPQISLLPERVVPSPERKQLNFALSQASFPNEDDFFNNSDLVNRTKDSPPSVIISVPEEVVNNAKRDVKENDLNAVFKTDGYYNEAEQAIEAALLRKGFNVLDRSKFEAKLRDLRDRVNMNRYWWSSYDRLLENKEYDAVKDLLKKQLNEEKITPDEYMDRIGEVDEISQIGLPGQNREEDEMSDIAEVIRAAQSGSDKAEYLLQINGVSVSDAGNRFLNIQEIAEVKSFMNQNPGLRFGPLPNALPTSIPSHWLRVEFNAKLIDVNTGSIVWLGSHELESWSAEPLKITIDTQRKVNNADEINGSIKKYNAKISRLQNDLRRAEQALRETYQKGVQQVKFDKKESYDSYRKQLQNEMNSKSQQHSTAINNLLTTTNQKPIESNADWTYSYIISEPSISPDLLSDGRNSKAGEQRLLRHRRELIREVTQQLIKTIEL